MTITKMYQIIMMFLLTYKRSLAQSANSQQPTANSQQPTAIIFTVTILYFVIYILRTRAVSGFEVFSHFILWLLFFYVYCGQFATANLFRNSDLMQKQRFRNKPVCRQTGSNDRKQNFPEWEVKINNFKEINK